MSVRGSDRHHEHVERAQHAMAQARGLSLAALIVSIDRGRGERPLASACRVAALEFAQA